MNKEKLEIFSKIYREERHRLAVEEPHKYSSSVLNNLDQSIDRMLLAVEAGTFNKDGAGFKYTCKRLGINCTYKAIEEYLECLP